MPGPISSVDDNPATLPEGAAETSNAPGYETLPESAAGSNGSQITPQLIARLLITDQLFEAMGNMVDEDNDDPFEE